MNPNHQSKPRKGLSVMKPPILTLIGLLMFCLAVSATHAGESPDGAWVVRLEAPFVMRIVHGFGCDAYLTGGEVEGKGGYRSEPRRR